MMRRVGGFEEDGNVKSGFWKSRGRRYQFGLKPIEGSGMQRFLGVHDLIWQLHCKL